MLNKSLGQNMNEVSQIRHRGLNDRYCAEPIIAHSTGNVDSCDQSSGDSGTGASQRYVPRFA